MLCPDCGSDKDPEDFPRNRSTGSGRGVYCKSCHNARTRASYTKQGGSRRYHLRAKYGLEPSDVERMIVKQGGLCPICKSRPAAHVDHDHKSGKVRAILCEPCNGMLGLFSDDPHVIRKAIRYLEAGGSADA